MSSHFNPRIRTRAIRFVGPPSIKRWKAARIPTVSAGQTNRAREPQCPHRRENDARRRRNSRQWRARATAHSSHCSRRMTAFRGRPVAAAALRDAGHRLGRRRIELGCPNQNADEPFLVVFAYRRAPPDLCVTLDAPKEPALDGASVSGRPRSARPWPRADRRGRVGKPLSRSIHEVHHVDPRNRRARGGAAADPDSRSRNSGPRLGEASRSPCPESPGTANIHVRSPIGEPKRQQRVRHHVRGRLQTTRATM